MPELLAAEIPLPREPRLSRAKIAQVDRFCQEWKQQVMDAARRHPGKSYRLGREQMLAFVKLMGELSGVAIPPEGTLGPANREAVKWMQDYTLHELDGALNAYIDKVKSALIYGLRGPVNPAQMASWMYRATHDGEVNWRMIARTEAARANAQGRLDAAEDMGYGKVWVPPHVGACAQCRRVLENKIFDIEEVRDASNYGRKPAEYIPCIPLHPHCRHVFLPYVPEVYEQAQEEYARTREAGLYDQRVIEELFDSGGHLRPGMENDPRLAALKTATDRALLDAILKARRERLTVRKGFFDNPQAGKDPLLFGADGGLRDDARQRLLDWRRRALGPDSEQWSRVFLTGGETGEQWQAIRGPERDPDVDVQVVVDYAALREARPWAAVSSDPELHAFLVSAIRIALDGAEAMPGLPIDAFIRPEHTLEDFKADMALAGQAAYDLDAGEWLLRQPPPPAAEAPGLPPLEGLGAVLAQSNPEWVAAAKAASDALDAILADGDPGRLRAAYTMLHDARAASFRPGGGGNAGRGNFIWQWAMAFGPLARVKAVLHGDIGKVFPDYAWSVPEPAEALPTREGQWPLDAGTAIVTKAGADVIADRLPLGAYRTFGGALVPHGAVERHEVAKMSGVPRHGKHPLTGVEHWITLHPHGPGTEGTPVLVRNNADGTMTVLAGAQGHLRMLGVDPHRRISSGQTGKPGEKLGRVENPTRVSEAQVAREEAKWRRQHEEATRALVTLNDSREHTKLALDDELHAIFGDAMDERRLLDADSGEVVGSEKLTGKEKRGLRSAIIFAARQTLLHGESAVYVQQGLMTRKVRSDQSSDAEREASEAERDREKREEQREGEAKPRKPRREKVEVSMTIEEAQTILRLSQADRMVAKQQSKARRVLAGDRTVTQVLALDWSDPKFDEKAEEKARAIQESDIGAQAVREALTVAENEIQRPSAMTKAVVQGGYDTLDSIAYAVIGKRIFQRETIQLLGIGGAAQMLAIKLYDYARQGYVDLKLIDKELDRIIDERETTLTQTVTARAKGAAAAARDTSEQERASKRGDADLTVTQCRSIRSRKMSEAATAIGMGIGSCEAAANLKLALQRAAEASTIGVTGFKTKGDIFKYAHAVGLELHAGDISRQPDGTWGIEVEPHRLDHLFDLGRDADLDHRLFMERITTGRGMAAQIEKERRNTPHYHRTLYPKQAEGKMFLLNSTIPDRPGETGAVIAFAPGVGKTDTAIAAALTDYQAHPDHRIVIVAPETALIGSWAKTVQEATDVPCQVIGLASPEAGSGGVGRKARREHQWSRDEAPPITIVGYSMFRQDQDVIREFAPDTLIMDESQTVKNDWTKVHKALQSVCETAKNRWALSGTPIEKNTGELHAQMKLVRQDPGLGTRKHYRDTFDRLAQWDSLTRPEKMEQFRSGLADGLFYAAAEEGGTALPTVNGQTAEEFTGEPEQVTVEMSPEQHAEFRRRIMQYNEEAQAWSDYRRGIGPKPPYSPPVFGGRKALWEALLRFDGPNPIVDRTVDLVADAEDFDFAGGDGTVLPEGANAGTYATKSVIFSNQISDMTALKKKLKARGITVYEGYGQSRMSSKENDAALQAFLDDPGKCVLLSSDKNMTARSLQFGANGTNPDGSPRFQHGATQMIHFRQPDNPANVNQRNARIWRKGSSAPIRILQVTANTPVEVEAEERRRDERSIQELAGASKKKLKATVGQRLRAKGQQPVLEAQERRMRRNEARRARRAAKRAEKAAAKKKKEDEQGA